MRVYVAAMYGRREEMLEVHRVLREAGHEPTARWVDGAEETVGEAAAGALMDLEDVRRAEVLLFHAQPHGSANTGGGRHFEFGYAHALRIWCVVIGEREQIFCHLPEVDVVPDLAGAVALLASRQAPTEPEGIYQQPHCTWEYCPHPEICRQAEGGCRFPSPQQPDTEEELVS